MKKRQYFLVTFVIMICMLMNNSIHAFVANNITDDPTTQNPQQENTIIKATFPGGPKGYQKWLSKNAIYPDEAQKAGIEETIVVKFTVEPNGKIKYPHIVEGENDLLIEEALRLVDKMPKWNPATCNGEPIESEVTWELEFYLTKKIELMHIR